jgi:hypothetical protein
MRVTLSVNLEKGENAETLISAHFDIDDKITTLEKETYHMLLSAVTAKMLMEKASETQTMLIEVMKQATNSIDFAMTLKKIDEQLHGSKKA